MQKNLFKGSERLSKVVELSMQCCRELLSDSFESANSLFKTPTLGVDTFSELVFLIIK